MPSNARYAALPSQHDPDGELDAAFEHDSDDEHDDERTALVVSQPAPTPTVPGAYDFEREYAYDYPPPGSPPPLTSHALPNDIGNSNGRLPTDPIVRPTPSRNIFRRAVGALLPSHYVRVPSSDSRTVVGAGLDNDGVFANVVAKPTLTHTPTIADDGSIYLAPELSTTSHKDIPPSYAAAVNDAVPAYWETTIHAPPGSGDPNADIIIDDLPVGGLWLFMANLVISFLFQFIGFLFTYVLHVSHAAKYGSRAGLGLTLLQLGFYSRTNSAQDIAPADPIPSGMNRTITPNTYPEDPTSPNPGLSITSRDWLAFLFMSVGWFLLLSSILSFMRLKRWESSIRAAANPRPSASPSSSETPTAPANPSSWNPPNPFFNPFSTLRHPFAAQARSAPSPELLQRDREIRRNLASVFGVGLAEDEEEGTSTETAAERARRLRERGEERTPGGA
ncbi:hypothetical protein DXG01_009563 [Tephrocybe rancida]|nr:hypothetical protein DXG01_009563 [Tephrocybe rancida]